MFSPNSSIPYIIQISLSLLLTALVFLSVYYLIYIGNKHVSDDKKIAVDIRKIVKLISIAAGLFIIHSLFNSYKILGEMFFAIFVSGLIAFIINPLVNKLEDRGLNRSQGTLLVYISIILAFIILGFLVVPKIHNEGLKLFSNLPKNIQYVLEKLEEFSESFDFINKNPNASNDIQNSIQLGIDNIQKLIVGWVSGIIVSLQSSLSKFVVAVLVPIITYYFLVDKEDLIKKVKAKIPEKYKDDIFYLARKINVAMHDFIRGRFIMAAFVGVSTMIMLTLLGIEFAFVIGIITLIADIIPYIGPFLGFVPALIFAFMQSPAKAIWVSILFVVIQWLENNVVGPKVLGSSTGLHPLVILLSIILGGGIFGVWGMILAVPGVAILLIFYDFFKYKYKKAKEDKLEKL